MQVAILRSICTSPFILRTGRILSSHPPQHMQVAILRSSCTTLCIPRTGRVVLRSQQLYHVQMPASCCLLGNSKRPRHVELPPRPGNQRNRQQVVIDSHFLRRRGCQLISPQPRHEPELRVTGGAQELSDVPQHDRKRRGGSRGGLHDSCARLLPDARFWRCLCRARQKFKLYLLGPGMFHIFASDDNIIYTTQFQITLDSGKSVDINGRESDISQSRKWLITIIPKLSNCGWVTGICP
jgi:hypothetical protein